MTRLLLLTILLGLMSCQKDVNISTTELYIKDGISEGIIVWKVKSENPKSYPDFPEYSEVAILKTNGPVKRIETLKFKTKTANFYWILENASTTNKFDTLPIIMENGYWYLINNFSLNESPYYIKFYINSKGQIVNEQFDYINRSPI